jgi:ribosomal protein S18 acetylase RimI-like enzyme
MESSVITLRAMRPAEFEAYRQRTAADVGAALAVSMSAEAAREWAHRDLARLLPDGLATSGHRVLVAENADGEVVGHLWLGMTDPRTGSPDLMWVYDLHVVEAHRRRGYGSAILSAAETLARTCGAVRLGLNVFGHNHAAIALYRAAGYQVTTQQMAKRLT